MAELTELKEFNFAESDVVLWTFKVSGAANETPRYSARWVGVDNEVGDVFRAIANSQTALIEETLAYSLTAQNNEGSALTLQTELTHAGLLMDATREQLENRKVKKISEMQNSAFYAMKFSHGGQFVFAIRKTGRSWNAKRAKGLQRVFYTDETLSLDERSPFEIEESVDLFILNDTAFLRNKKSSESVLAYKQAHLEDFAALQAEPEFEGVFSEMTALSEYIGNNKMQLRRAAAIREKGHYKDKGFMDRLHKLYDSQLLDIKFDDAGKIVASESNAADIMTALLDHRLSSAFSEQIYNTQDTQLVVA